MPERPDAFQAARALVAHAFPDARSPWLDGPLFEGHRLCGTDPAASPADPASS